MKTMFVAGMMALAAAGSVYAQSGNGMMGGKRGGGFAMLDTDKNGALSQAEACGGPRGTAGRLCVDFATIDANKDGALTQDELRAAMQARFGHKGERGQRGFAKLDTDGNGSISQTEACAGPKGTAAPLCTNFSTLDTTKDGQLSKDELRAGHAARAGAKGQRAGRGIAKLDTDGNGAISQAEACGGPKGSAARVCSNFAAIDANKDGNLTKDEMMAYGQAQHGKRHGS